MPGYAPIPVLPDLYTWAEDEIIPAPYLRASVAAAAQLLSAPPIFIGSQQASDQSIPSASNTALTIDTDTWDSAAGHSPITDAGRYYCRFPGYYLAETTVPLNCDTGPGNHVSALTGFSSAGGAVTWWGGGLIPNAQTGGEYAMPTASKLLQLVNAGPAGSASADYITPGAYQDSGSAQSTAITTSVWPQFQVTWVAALAGTAGLAVPANPAWPVPPDYITSAFMNTNVTGAIAFLIYPPLMEACYAAGTATLASSDSLATVGTTLPLDTVVYDTYSAFDTTTYTWTAPAAGTYYTYGQMGFAGNTTSAVMAAGLTVTSANYNGGSPVTLWEGSKAAAPAAISDCATVRRRLRLNAGDTVALAGMQHDTGGNAVTLQGSGNAWVNRLITIWRSA